MFSFVVPLCVSFCVPAFVNSCSVSASSVVSFVYHFILKSSFLTSVLLPACAFLLIVCTAVFASPDWPPVCINCPSFLLLELKVVINTAFYSAFTRAWSFCYLSL